MDKRQFIEEIRKIDTPTICNAIEKLEVRSFLAGFCDRTIQQLMPEFGVMCGYAVTAQAETITHTPLSPTESRANMMELCKEVGKLKAPAVVVFQEVGPEPAKSAHCGEVMATTFKKFGAVGLISDSAVRDVDQVRDIGFQLFAPGTVASHGNFRIVRVQVPVSVAGITINPGDLLHGDDNGLTTIPEEKREQLLKEVESIMTRESKILDYLKEENVTTEKLFYLMTH